MALPINLYQIWEIISNNSNDIKTTYDKTKSTADDLNNVSITNYIKDSFISSRTYIQQDLADDGIIKDIMMNLYNIYTGYILTALQMNRYVENGKKIRDFIQVVATEEYRNALDIVQESFNLSMNKTKDTVSNKTNASLIKIPNDVSLPTGRMIKVDMTGGDDNKTKLSINLLVQLFPTFIPAEVVEAFVSLNFEQNNSRRWKQYTAGEIKFWKDFVFQRDILAKRKKAMLKDDTNILSEMLMRQNSDMQKAIGKAAGMGNNVGKQNIANTILIFDKHDFKQFCNNSSVNWKSDDIFSNSNDRQAFFDKTFSMIVVLVDTRFEKIEMYFNGIDKTGIYTYDQVKSASNKDGSSDLKSLLTAFSQGQAPKL